MGQAAAISELRDKFHGDSTFASIDPEVLPASWHDGIAEILPKYFPFAFRNQYSVRYFMSSPERIEPYLEANAIRKRGRDWIVHLRRFAVVWSELND